MQVEDPERLFETGPAEAARFRRALFRRWRPRVKRIHALAAFAAFAGAVPVGVLLLMNRSDRGSGLADLAILPFDVRFAADSSYARAVTHLIADYLRDIPELVLVPSETAQRWWLRSDPATHADETRAAAALRARHVAAGTVTRVGDDMHIRELDSLTTLRSNLDLRASA